MRKQKFDRMKTIFGILMLVFLVVSLTTMSASAQNYNNNYVRSFPYGAPTLYQQNNMSYMGPFYPPAPYGDSGDSEVVCGPYGCYWNEATAYLPQIVLAEQAW
jgi:hypothetical protein